MRTRATGRPISADRFRQANDIGLDAGILEGEELAGAPAARLNVIDDQQRAAALGQRRKTLEPPVRRGVEPTLPLNGLDEERGRRIDAAAGVFDRLLDQGDRVDVPAMVSVERQSNDVAQVDMRPLSLRRVGGRGERTQRHAVEAVGERGDRRSPGHLARDFQRRLDGVGAVGPENWTR